MRALRTILLTTVALTACLWVALDAPRPAHATGRGDARTEATVTALLAGADRQALAELPADFREVRGYTPAIEDGILVDPGGECSSPVALPAGFDPVCRRHDLGYDLIRYADRVGHPLPPSTRHALDDQFADGLRDACASHPQLGCRAWAEVAAAAVRFNSWRQHWAAPWHETPASIAQAASGVGGVLAAVGLAGLGAVALARRAAGLAGAGAGAARGPRAGLARTAVAG